MPTDDIVAQLFEALEHRQTEQISILISKLDPKDLEQKDSKGDTLLIKAAEFDDLASLSALIAAKAFPDAQNKKGFTALMYAASNGRADLVSQLLLAKATVDMQTHHGSTAFFLASMDSRIDIMRQLLEAKASINKEDYYGNSPLDNAIFSRKTLPLINFLLKHHADLRGRCRALYDLLISLDDKQNILITLIALYKQCKLAIDLGYPNPLTEAQLHHLEQIYDYSELHKKNVRSTLDNATNNRMPDALLNMIAEYNTPEENLSLKELSFFNREKFNKAINIEQGMDTLFRLQHLIKLKR